LVKSKKNPEHLSTFPLSYFIDLGVLRALEPILGNVMGGKPIGRILPFSWIGGKEMG